MLIGFGGPTSEAEVRPFLDRVLAGRPVPRERYEEVVRHYEAFGGRSPYNEMTMRQAAALQDELRRMGICAPVVVGFHNTPPFFDDALRDLKQRGIRRALGFVLAAHRSEASWDRYLDEIRLMRERLAAQPFLPVADARAPSLAPPSDAPEIDYPPPWHTRPEFIEAVSDRARAALERLDPRVRERAELIFTAHSIPLSMGGRAGYVEQLHESARLIAQQLGYTSWTLAFQSRSGSPRDPWLEPDICDVLRRLAGAYAVVVPVGFLCDHIEVLYDLDIEAAKVAREAGVTMVRAATVGEHPKFIEMIAKIASQYLPPALSDDCATQ
jgi:protoporphyrin/coproporphyrin ferrochelatase